MKAFTSSAILALTAAAAGMVAAADGDEKLDSASAKFVAPPFNGLVKFTPADKGASIVVNITSGLVEGEQYPWHIHQFAVPANGSCDATGGHLDPFQIKKAGMPYTCDKNTANVTCEMGDLSGMFGNLTTTAAANGSAQLTATAPYLEFTGNNTILDKALVIHDSKGKRVACTNITQTSEDHE
ncbi:Cu,Zn superoxide dismutase-like protein [Ramicandelaber brevisporus]|nr:Cu,Zn superoxide dismutase-like protein [Ramicandelaber brevisporus]